MEFDFKSENKAKDLIEIIENFQLLFKISPPQIKYELLDKSKGLVHQTFYIKSIKKNINFQIVHKKISENSFLSEIISGPLKGTKTKMSIIEKNEKSIINVEFKLKLSFSYKIFSSILSKKIKSVNIILFNRLEKFVKFLHNKKYEISFEKNYEVLIIKLENKNIFFAGWWLGDISSSFIENVYNKLSIKDKIIIDVGANIGDTAISFINSGAKKVIGLEPFPINYKFFKENVIRNEFENQIEVLQGGCSSKSSEIFIDPNLSGLSYQMENKEKGEKINQFSLDELIEKYKITDGVIKMNCEGCEYDTIINTPNNILNKFSQILIQYHNGPEELIEKLESVGFNVMYESYSNMKGQIFANRVT